MAVRRDGEMAVVHHCRVGGSLYMRVSSAVNVSELPVPNARAVLLVGNEFVLECECEVVL